jgi:hypothetical protein
VALPAFVLYWHLFPSKQIIDIPPSEITKGKGLTYQWKIPHAGFWSSYRSDNSQYPTASTLSLFENGIPLTLPHSSHKVISNLGLGRFSHWGDTLYFSTSDNSPLANSSRKYRIEVEAVPGPVVVYSSALTLFVWLITLSFSVTGIRRLLTASTFLAVIAAIAATFTRVSPYRYDLTFSHAQSVREENLSEFPNYILFRYSIEPLVAPFLEINFTPPLKTDQLQLRIGKDAPLAVVLNDEINPFTWEPRSNFVLDSRSVLYGVESSSSDSPNREVRLNSPLSVTKGGVLLLWILSGILLVNLLLQRFSKNPLSRLALLGATSSITLGGFLLACSIFGLFLSLDKRDLKDLKGTPFGSRDRVLTWEDTKALLRALPSPSQESDTIQKASRLVAERVLHNWNYVDRDTLHMQFPIWKNWVLWFFGELSPKYRRYIIADLPSALERGVGHCGQASLVLTTLLRSYGVSASIVGLSGHTIVSATKVDGGEFILDPDFGITFSGTYNEYIQEPGLSLRYGNALKDLGMREDAQPYVLKSVLSIFKRSNPTRSSPEQFHGNTSFEQSSYLYKWLIPLVLVLVGLIFLSISNLGNRRLGSTGD